MGKYYFDNEGSVFSIEEEAEYYRMRVWRSRIEEEHVEDFLDTTVEWLSSNPQKGILIDFAGVRSVCAAFTIELCRHYEDIKRRGLYVRFVNVDPTIQPYVDVQDITVVMNIMPRKPVLSAKAVLEDLAKDMSDHELMRKYGLSEKGLASLFKKLMRKGLITDQFFQRRQALTHGNRSSGDHSERRGEKPSVNAMEVLKDLDSNLSDSKIMAKFNLSRKHFDKVINKLQSKGLLSRAQLDRRKKRH